MADRNALLQQIQRGKGLKKTQTNDRSSPQIGKAGGSSSGGGGGPPMGLPRPPVPPVSFSATSSGNGRAAAESRPAAAPAPAPAMAGLGGLFAGGMPKLKHRSGGVSTGRTSEDGGASPARSGPSAAAAPPPPPQAEQKTGASRFALPFRRNSHARSSSQADAASVRSELPQRAPAPGSYSAAKAPVPPTFNGGVALPARRPSDADSAQPPRPASSVSTKKAPPPPPSSRKPPRIGPKPPGIGAGRLTPQGTPAAGSTPDLRATLRPAPSSPVGARPAADEAGIIQESQGSVSALAGMFGQRAKGAAHGRAPVAHTFAAPAPGGLPAHRRTGSSVQAPSHQPPPPPSLPRRTSGAADAPGVPVREGKWTFHALADLPPPPPPPAVTARHVYPSGRSAGSAVALDLGY
ncbi:verprolin [Coemansia sp. RSA 1286]|nr:verprolin [Coemansia sp. RSA 1286]